MVDRSVSIQVEENEQTSEPEGHRSCQKRRPGRGVVPDELDRGGHFSFQQTQTETGKKVPEVHDLHDRDEIEPISIQLALEVRDYTVSEQAQEAIEKPDQLTRPGELPVSREENETQSGQSAQPEVRFFFVPPPRSKDDRTQQNGKKLRGSKDDREGVVEREAEIDRRLQRDYTRHGSNHQLPGKQMSEVSLLQRQLAQRRNQQHEGVRNHQDEGRLIESLAFEGGLVERLECDRIQCERRNDRRA